MFWFDRLTFETRADGSKWRADTGEAEETLQGDATWAGEGSVEEEEEDGDGAAPWEHGGLIAAVTPKHADGGDERLFATVAARGEREVQEDDAAGEGGGGGARVRVVDAADELMACDELRRELTMDFDFTEVMEAEAAERRAVVEGARLQRIIRLRDAAAVAPLGAAAGVCDGQMTRDGEETVLESTAMEALLRRLGSVASAGAAAQPSFQQTRRDAGGSSRPTSSRTGSAATRIEPMTQRADSPRSHCASEVGAEHEHDGGWAVEAAAAQADALLLSSPRGRTPHVRTAVGVTEENGGVEYTYDNDGTPGYVEVALEALRSEALR